MKITARISTKLKTRTAHRSWRQIFQRRRVAHDPMLVVNMSIFNFGGGWDRVFNPFRVRENAG